MLDKNKTDRKIAKPFIRATGVNVDTQFHLLTTANIERVPSDAQRAIKTYLQESHPILCTQEGFSALGARPFRAGDVSIRFVVYDAKRVSLQEVDRVIPDDAHKYDQIFFEPEHNS